MGRNGKQEKKENKFTKRKTFQVPFAFDEIKENIIISADSKSYREKIINQAINFHLKGNIQEAIKYYQYCINQGFNDHKIFSNYGIIMKDFGKLKEAELSLRKAIELKPDFSSLYTNLGSILKDLGNLEEAELLHRKAINLKPDSSEAHNNLGNLLKNLGRLKEAELSIRKAIKLRPNYAKAYYDLSLLKFSGNSKIWQEEIFSEGILNNQSQEDLVNIYFARANILHAKRNYKESSKYLIMGNNLKLSLSDSKPNALLNKSKVLLIESDKQKINQKEKRKYPQSIFIVGMPRSGSTLLESILSMNNDVDDLGEINILEESFLEWKDNDQKLDLSQIYWEKITNQKSKLNITTNKWLYNYQYAGIISSQIPNAKIFHCYRNPLDNILSMYREHFAKGNQYCSSLLDCTKVYLDQEKVMAEYKNRFRNIYDLNYDLLVSQPNHEIKSLISWLGWKWDDTYLAPHLNPRSVSTASNVQVRSPINSKSTGGWKNYKEMLKPVIEILTQTDRYRDLIS